MISLLLRSKPMLIVGAVTLAIGLAGGYKVADWKCDAERLRAVERALQQQAEEQAVIDEIESQYWEDQLNRNIRWRTIEKEVVKYVKDNGDVQCLTADGVQLWNSANQNSDPTESSN